MRAGQLRHRINVDEPAAAQNNTGEEVVGFVPTMTVQASIEPLAGREGVLANSITATADTRITIRWSPNAARINAEWRLRHGPFCGCGTPDEIIYNIKAPPKNLDTRNREIELLVSSGANRG